MILNPFLNMVLFLLKGLCVYSEILALHLDKKEEKRVIYICNPIRIFLFGNREAKDARKNRSHLYAMFGKKLHHNQIKRRSERKIRTEEVLSTLQCENIA